MVDRDVEERLNLRLVQVHREHPVGAGRGDHVGDQLGRDRHARLVLAILPGVAVIRDHGGDARRRRAAERVDHDQHLDEVLIDRRASRLHQEHVGAADVLVDLERHLGIGEAAQTGLADGHAQELGDLTGQARMRTARKHLEIPEARLWHRLSSRIVPDRPGRPPEKLVGAEGFEPSNTGSKGPRLTAWPRPIILGRLPSPAGCVPRCRPG